jgi:hypothetical protein
MSGNVLGRFFENFETGVRITCVLTIRQNKNLPQVTGTSCIRESFVGNYRVNNDSGLHSRVTGQGGRQVPLLLVALTAKVQT